VGKKLNKDEKTYQTPAPDFELHVFDLKPGRAISFQPITAEIMLLTDGVVELTNGSEILALKKGSPSAIVFPDQTIQLKALAKATVFRATVPQLR
jgi:mannose-6-phosphate isomerase